MLASLALLVQIAYLPWSLGNIKEGTVRVYAVGGPSSGLTHLQAGGDAVRYAKSVEAGGFVVDFFRTLNQP